MNEVDPGARIQLRNRSELQFPSGCALCGKDAHPEGFVDFDIFVEFFGNFYLCMDCMNQAANTVGMLTTEESTHIQKQLSELAATVEVATTALRTANERLDDYDRLFVPVITDVLTASRDADNDASEQHTEPEGDNDKTVVASNGAGKAEAKPAESVSGGKRPGKTTRITSSDSIL